MDGDAAVASGLATGPNPEADCGDGTDEVYLNLRAMTAAVNDLMPGRKPAGEWMCELAAKPSPKPTPAAPRCG